MTHMMPSSILSGPKSRRSILLKPISIMINVTGLGWVECGPMTCYPSEAAL